jgi:hypothetical protein
MVAPGHPPEPFEWQVVNRSRAAQARKKYKLEDLNTFVNARRHFPQTKDDLVRSRDRRDVPNMLLEDAPDFEGIYQILTRYIYRGDTIQHIRRELGLLRRLIYKREGCLDTHTTPYVSHWTEAHRIFDAQRKY